MLRLRRGLRAEVHREVPERVAHTPIRLSFAVVLAASVLAAGACADAERNVRGRDSRTAVDTIEGVVHTRNLTAPAEIADIRSSRDLTVGQAEGPEEYVFGQVWSVVVDATERIYALDALRRELLRYSVTGEFEAAIGRQGPGPGEFLLPIQAFWAGESVAVWDQAARRLSVFSREGTLLRDTLLLNWGAVRRIEWVSGGEYVVQTGPTWSSPPPPEGSGIASVLHLHWNEGRVDTVVQWRDSSSAAYQAPGVSIVVAIPFAPRPSWDLTDANSVLFTPAGCYCLFEYALDGALRRTIEVEHSRASLTQGERDSVRLKIASYDPEVRGQVPRLQQKPSVGALHVAADGRIWIEVYSANEAGRRRWDVLDPDGTFQNAVWLPANLDVKVVTRLHIYGVSRDTLGVVRIERYRANP